jgi:CBS-domain-containing membrane protein
MRVRDIMTPDVVSCNKETDIGTAAKLMLEGGFGTLPVVDPQRRLIGIITDRDIAMAAATRERTASRISVYEAMTNAVRSCFADDDVGTVLKQMQEARVRRLPVINVMGCLGGIVSIDDIVVRALDRTGGISSSALVNALTRICEEPSQVPHERPHR